MSAKEFHKKTVIHIELLPDDLLGEVLRHATWVPYGIDPTDMVGKRFQSSHAKDLTRKYRASLVTRRYLVRVCKKWHRLAFLYLYEWVLASRLKNLKGVVHTLEQPRSGTGTRVGWCTKRLDIDFQITGGETIEEIDQEELLVLRLLRAVPNILVLTLGACRNTIWTTPTWAQTCCLELEFLNSIAGTDESVFDSEDWVDFAHSHPNLIAFNPGPPGYRGSSITRTSPSPHHTLKELTLGYSPHLSVGSAFTSLSRLNIDFEIDSLHADPQWSHNLITQPLPSVTTLQLSFSYDAGALEFNFTIVAPLFRFLPNLHRIDLVLPSFPQTWPSYTFPSKVSVFGLRVCLVKPKKQTIKWLLEELNRVVRGALSPLRVQFLDRRTMQWVCMYEDYVVRNTRVEDVLQSWLDPEGNLYNLHK